MLILASKSPRRKQLLETVTKEFIVDISDIEEVVLSELTPEETVSSISLKKGQDVFLRHKNDVVISADTIVLLGDEILGKPKNENDAIRILNKLSNKVHKVLTAYHILFEDKIISNIITSEVKFNKLDKSLIEAYVKSGSPMDKAGAYGVQDNNKFPIIKYIKGSYTNIVGFPIEEIKSDLITNHLI